MPAAQPAEPPAEDLPEDLTRLAALHGVATSYRPSPDRTVPATATAVTLALAALGVDASSPGAVRAALTARETELRGRLLPPTVVRWDGGGTPAALAALPAGTRLRVDTEQGERLDGVGRLPHGVHRLTATAPDGRTADAHLIVAPARLPAPAVRSYGLLVQLYSLLSRRSWGMGDLGDLGELAAWAGRSLGAGFVQVNPLHAAVPGAPADPSPYRPSSRRFPDPVHLRIEDVPEFAYVTDHERARSLRERAGRLREGVLEKDALIDRDAVWELKREALELLHEVPWAPAAAPPTATTSPNRAPPWRTTPPGARSPRSTAPTGTAGPRACATPARPAPTAPAAS